MKLRKNDFITQNPGDLDDNIDDRFRVNDAEFRIGLNKGIKEKDMRERIKLNKEKQTDENIKEDDKN